MRSGLRGRPTKAESSRRERELVRLVYEGMPLHEAAVAARINPDRVLRLLDEDRAFFAAYCALQTEIAKAAA